VRHALDRLGGDVAQGVPVAQPVEELGQAGRQALGTDAVGGRPRSYGPAEVALLRMCWSATDTPQSMLGGRIAQEHQRVLPGVAGDGTELVQKLALLPSADTRVARRKSSRQVVPTSLLHAPIVIASGRICFEAHLPCRVGKILTQRGTDRRRSCLERMFYLTG